ncbi:hypothetical protein MMC17_007111 [Xylographa soralifera]|nr:hypothetical protein [Xylographa soralifera]
MEILDFRLQELEQTEITLTTAWGEIINKRKIQDLELTRQRKAEDVRWRKRLEERDREEDVSNMAQNFSEALIPPFTSKLVARSAQILPTEAIRDSAASIDESKKALEDPETDKRFGPRSPIGDRSVHPFSLGSNGQLICTRPSDGALVSLKCCVGACEKSDFKTMQGLRAHVTCAHGVKDLFENVEQAIEKCGVLVVKAEHYIGAESLKDGISTSEVEDHNTETPTHRSLGYRVEL